ncbi:helix-turn-helix domain-containing protein [Terriglobus tenax]|uniref:helix-turn-helix domain-containing protein n=1 Tax=Terriglobus tenax TaxID=1111115 RepID=UPI0021DF70FC|nr:helix-turn-helix transcriptional regulator [Terriglobus tenax]
MKWDFRHHLLLQIEMLRGELSHQELSKRLGDIHERCLARYIAGKSHLTERDFNEIAKALGVGSDVLARTWASSLGLSVSGDAVTSMVHEAHMRWLKSSRIHGVPSSPSPMAIIRAKYSDQLSWKTPPLWFGARRAECKRKGTPEEHARFARAYAMLIESVHGGLSAREIGAMRGISASRATYLMVCAAYRWADSKKIDLLCRSVPFKNEALFVKQLYAGLEFFAQQKFHELAKEARAARAAGNNKDSL